MRHAEADQSGATDADRPLTERGAAAAREAGGWLAAQGIRAEAALVSSARRAQETWAAVCVGGEADESVASVEHGLYSAGPESVLDLVREVSDDVRTLVVVGHNPTMSVVAMTVDDGDSTVLLDNPGFPPAAVVVFDVPEAWAHLDAQAASAVAFHVGCG